MNRRYFVTVKDLDVFMFDDEEKMNAFIQDIQKRKSDVKFAVTVVGDDKFDIRGG